MVSSVEIIPRARLIDYLLALWMRGNFFSRALQVKPPYLAVEIIAPPDTAKNMQIKVTPHLAEQCED
jgi:hypothetical protein